ncbi:MAG TPA: hypothetical protein PLW65_23395 [Pseudomonadota bacterium]|nr:hypothetical protein [Pseudomonadota bacterium]
MNHPLIAAASGVLFGCVLCTSISLMDRRPAPLSTNEPPAVLTPVQVVEPDPPPPVPSCPALAPEPETATDCADPDVTLGQAQTAYVNGDYAEAIDLAELCAEVAPIRAMRIIGAASCIVQDLECLRTAYRNLDAPGRQYLVYVCQRNGITFRPHGKHLIARIVKEKQ